jgi:hypothetical protein
MKTTVELPDEMLTELKVIAARERRKLREVVEQVVSLGLAARRQGPVTETTARASAEAWLRGWQALGQRIEDSSADPRSCVAILLADRR